MKKDVETMRSRYIIGFFAVFLIFALLHSAGYKMTYDRVAERQTAREENTDARSITAEGEAVQETEDGKEEGYYLCELQGFVVVYLKDRETIYEFTEIPVSDLPEEVQQEIVSGKYISSQEELYAFLENYSS